MITYTVNCNEYHNYNFCPICESKHTLSKIDYESCNICECDTSCECGHTDHWAYGYYESTFNIY